MLRRLRCAMGTGNYRGTGKIIPFVNCISVWGAVIATVLVVLSSVPLYCARLTCFLHPKVRNINAVRMTLTLRCAVSAPTALRSALIRELTKRQPQAEKQESRLQVVVHAHQYAVTYCHPDLSETALAVCIRCSLRMHQFHRGRTKVPLHNVATEMIRLCCVPCVPGQLRHPSPASCAYLNGSAI